MWGAAAEGARDEKTSSPVSECDETVQLGLARGIGVGGAFEG